MSIETELKLRITSGQLAKLKRHSLFKQYAVTRSITRRLYNIYFDTSKLTLNKKAMALRLRRADLQWLQTLKGGGSVEAGLHRRNEWEIPVKNAELDFSSPEAAEFKKNLPKSLRTKLQPVFITDFTRNSRMLNFQGAEIELCIDQGKVYTPKSREPESSTAICELELELKSGNPQQLFELALAILDVVTFELETISKAEQGYRLLSGHTDKPTKSLTVQQTRKEMLAEVLQKMIWSCVQHLQDNLPGVLGRDGVQSDDVEYLHQVRIALSRLRVVLQMAADFHPDEQLATLTAEVAALCDVLECLRDWDMLIAQTLLPMHRHMEGDAGLKILLQLAENKSADCYTILRSEDQARELQRLLLRIAVWMNGSYWQAAPSGIKAYSFATQCLRKQAARFNRAEKDLHTLELDRLRDLSIQAGKLQCSAGLFASLYDKPKAGTFLKALRKMKKVLNQLNDVSVANQLLDELAADDKLVGHREVITLVQGWLAHDRSDQFPALKKAVKRFNKRSAFWEK